EDASTDATRNQKEKPFIQITFNTDELQTLTPKYLVSIVTPYLDALGELQKVIDEMLGRTPSEIQIKVIRQQSPISVSLKGVAEAIQVVKDTVVPWRRKHAENMARLFEIEKQADIENKKAEILEKRAGAAKSRAELEKIAAEASQQRAKAERIKLENEKL